MEWAVVILLSLNMALLAVMILLAAGGLAYMRSHSESSSPVPSPVTPTPVKPSKDEVPLSDESVPIEQFTPDFKKPIKFVIEEDENTTLMEEKDEN